MKAEGIDQLYSEMRRSKLRETQKSKKKERSESSKLGKRASETKLDGRDHGSGRGRMDRGLGCRSPTAHRRPGASKSSRHATRLAWLSRFQVYENAQFQQMRA